MNRQTKSIVKSCVHTFFYCQIKSFIYTLGETFDLSFFFFLKNCLATNIGFMITDRLIYAHQRRNLFAKNYKLNPNCTKLTFELKHFFPRNENFVF